MFQFHLLFFIFALPIFVYLPTVSGGDGSVEQEVYGVKYASQCEVCKLLVIELENKLAGTGKSHDIIETGYTFDPEKRTKKKYAISELRLIESLEDICNSLLDYNIHKEREDSTRFSKGMSSTFKTLHGLVAKGVKVDLGIPYDLWDKPSAEITNLKSQCEQLIEKHEADIERWYFHHQEEKPLVEYLCADRLLKKGEAGCLTERLIMNDEEKAEALAKQQTKQGGDRKTEL